MSKTENGRIPGLNAFSAVTGWMVWMLIALFACLSLALIVLGTQAYRSIEASAAQNLQRRTSVGYLLSRLAAADSAGGIQIGSCRIGDEEIDVLLLTEEIDGEDYETRVFCAEGWLREQFVHAEIPLVSAEDAERIAQLNGLSIQRTGNRVDLELVHPDGLCETVHAAVHAAEEVAP